MLAPSERAGQRRREAAMSSWESCLLGQFRQDSSPALHLLALKATPVPHISCHIACCHSPIERELFLWRSTCDYAISVLFYV